jgi:CheY-like chemotaxis protein
VPAQDEADELGALLFLKLLESQGISARQTTVNDLPEAMEQTTSRAIICVSAISLPALENAQRLIKPLHACYPDVPILAGLWDAAPQTRETDLAELLAAGATQVVTTLQHGLDVVSEWPEEPLLRPRIAGARIS